MRLNRQRRTNINLFSSKLVLVRIPQLPQKIASKLLKYKMKSRINFHSQPPLLQVQLALPWQESTGWNCILKGIPSLHPGQLHHDVGRNFNVYQLYKLQRADSINLLIYKKLNDKDSVQVKSGSSVLKDFCFPQPQLSTNINVNKRTASNVSLGAEMTSTPQNHFRSFMD